MADLVVTPAYQFGPSDILTADKLNLLATPIVQLSISDRVDDQSFLRNGNFYSSFWTTPAGMPCPINVETSNADYWTVNPTGADVTCLRSTTVPDLNSLFSMEVQGNAATTDVRMSQVVNADLSATMRRMVTFSGYIYNGAGLSISPKLEIWTCGTFNNFNTLSLQQTEDLQTCAVGLWTYVSVGFDLTNVVNVANGLRATILIPSGGLSATTKYVLFSRIKFQIGEIATEFVDDVGLFVQTPSVDSTMLQDGCIARPALFLPDVVPTGAYTSKSINNGDLNDGSVDGRTLVQSVTTTLSAGFTQPAVSSTVSIAVVSTAGFRANQPIVITGGGAYVVSSVTDATHMVVTNSGGSGNTAPAAPVPTGGNVYQASGVVENLGYVPINKTGDSGIGPGPLQFTNDDVVGSGAPVGAAIVVNGSSANNANDGYMPAISFNRPSKASRAIGLDSTGRFKTVDQTGKVAYLLDSNYVAGTAGIQDGAITYAKLAQSLIDLLVPIGTVHLFAGVNVPGGWFVCNGSAVSRTTYAALFAQLGTYWGTGDNVNTFNIPNFVNRSPVGYGTGANWGFGTYGGEVNHTLSPGEMPVHAHPITDQQHNHSDSGHTHSINPTFVGGGGGIPSGSGWLLGGSNTGTGYAAIQPSWSNINHTEAQGGSGAHNNMHPYGVCYYIIKAV